MNKDIEKAKEKFGLLLEGQLKRITSMKAQGDYIDYNELKPIIIGIVGGDGIGPTITSNAQEVLEFLLQEEISSGKVKFKEIEGLTIENRAQELKAIPEDILQELKKCHVILKDQPPPPGKEINGPILKVPM